MREIHQWHKHTGRDNCKYVNYAHFAAETTIVAYRKNDQQQSQRNDVSRTFFENDQIRESITCIAAAETAEAATSTIDRLTKAQTCGLKLMIVRSEKNIKRINGAHCEFRCASIQFSLFRTLPLVVLYLFLQNNVSNVTSSVGEHHSNINVSAILSSISTHQKYSSEISSKIFSNNIVATHREKHRLPSPTDSVASSASSLFAAAAAPLLGLSSNQIILEELLQESSLDDAIHKLKNVWNQVHGSNKSKAAFGTNTRKKILESKQSEVRTKQIDHHNMISSSQGFSLGNLNPLSPQTKNDLKYVEQPSSDNRVRRSTEDKLSDDNRANADATTLYHQNATKNNELVLPKEKVESEPHNSNTYPSMLITNCTRCRLKEQARSLRIESIKFNILNKLGMERAPNVSLKSLPKIPPISHLLQLQPAAMMFGDDPFAGQNVKKRHSNDYFGPLLTNDNESKIGDDFYMNAEKSIIFAQSPPPEREVMRKLRSQYFKFPVNIVNSQIQRATLWLYLKGTNIRKANASAHIIIYKVVREETPLVVVHKKKLGNGLIRRGGWVQIELKSLVAHWFEKPDANLGLSIHSYDSDGVPLTIIHYDDASFESSMRPFFEVRVSTQLTDSIRRKRMTMLNCDDKSSQVSCCRYPLTIDFETFGWDWIIAPKRYEANYCSGECGLPFMNPHTHIVHQTNHQMYNPTGPCCSPRKMSPISMLYMDADWNIIFGILPNMVVDKCDCS